MAIDDLSKHLRIATPCTASWDEMTGDDKVRYCGQCHLNVYNSAAMTDEEVLRTLSGIAQGKRVCMRMYRRQDGTILTKDCPVGLRKLQERLRRAAAFLAGGLSVFLMLPAFAQRASVTICRSGQPSTEEGNGGTKQKPTWHSKIKASGNPLKSSQKAGAATAPSLNQPVSNRPLMGDVAYSPQYLMQLHRNQLKEAERLHGVNSTNAAEALATLHRELVDVPTPATLAEADGMAKRAVQIFTGAKQYIAAQAICELQLSAAQRIGNAAQITYWKSRNHEAERLIKARELRREQGSTTDPPEKLELAPVLAAPFQP